MAAPDVVIERLGCCGAITLNRQAALNALDLAMIDAIAGALDAFEGDSSVRSVLIRSGGGRAFCAGADIRALYSLGKAGRRDEQLAFFSAEYRLNRRIKLYPKPILALADGIVMGGGAGLSVHARHCVAGDALDFAMPEAGIGFFPDVGATFFLPRLPGRIGAYLALTGARIGCGDAVALGLASAYAPTVRHAALTDRLIDGEDAAAAVTAEARPAPAAALAAERAAIDRCFAAPTVAAIAAALAAEGGAFAAATGAALAAKSPTSLAIALQQMQIGIDLDIDEALRTEFRIAARVLLGEDYYEGVRALVIDKDHRPRWRPASLDAVDEAAVAAYFRPLAGAELDFLVLAASQ